MGVAIVNNDFVAVLAPSRLAVSVGTKLADGQPFSVEAYFVAKWLASDYHLTAKLSLGFTNVQMKLIVVGNKVVD